MIKQFLLLLLLHVTRMLFLLVCRITIGTDLLELIHPRLHVSVDIVLAETHLIFCEVYG